MKKLLLPVALPLLVAALLLVLPISGEEDIYRDVVRLHILAESDSDAAQSDKLAVRDAVLAEYGQCFAALDSPADADLLLDEAMLCEIGEFAESVLDSRGVDAAVEVLYTVEQYPRRTYELSGGESVTLPAGEYRSLRIVIGAGEGKNWWCVLYPPLCTAAAIEGVPLGLSDAEYRLMTSSGFKPKLRALEVFKALFD